MNEATAKTKWCPFTLQRITVMLDPSHGEQIMKQGEARQGACNCIASGCMAWRVTGAEFTGENIAVRTPGGGGRIEKETRPTGECGMVAAESPSGERRP